VVLGGFVIVLLLVFSTFAYSFLQFRQAHTQLIELVNDTEHKQELAYGMRDRIRQRVYSLELMKHEADPFELDDERMRFYSYAGQYARLRQMLVQLSHAQVEQQAILDLDAATRQVRGPNARALQALSDASPLKAERVQEAIDGHFTLLRVLDQFLDFQRESSAQQVLSSQESFRYSVGVLVISALAVLVLSLLIATGIARALRKKNVELSYQALHDHLTGLVNRAGFQQKLNHILQDVQAFRESSVLLYMDLDRFKAINDTCGHLAGDQLLRQLAEQMKAEIRGQDVLARLGGDEFGLILQNCQIDQGTRLAKRIREKVENYRFHWRDQDYGVGVSIGVVAIDDQENDAEALLGQVDAACYLAKTHGHKGVHVVNTQDHSLMQVRGDMNWVHRIDSAIINSAFEFDAQPIVRSDADEGSLPQRYELLLRMVEKGQRFSPDEFIPAAERYQLMDRIDAWVLEHAIQWMKQHSGVGTCINLSAQSLSNLEFQQKALSAINKADIDASDLCIELTETAMVSHIEKAVAFIQSLRVMGVRIAIDDFGSGVASFAYLQHFPVDFIKIDGALIQDLQHNRVLQVTVRSIVEIAALKKAKTVAEYVENNAERDLLRRLGVDYLQGYLLGHPAPATDL